MSRLEDDLRGMWAEGRAFCLYLAFLVVVFTACSLVDLVRQP